jgi:DNA-binding GntR family transcriptional regulator
MIRNLPAVADAASGSLDTGFESAQLGPVVRHVGGRTSDRVFDQLTTAIRDLRLPPGTSLSEQELTRQLGVSRTPVREAIARLVDGGLVQVVPQVGTTVARIRMSDVEEARFIRESLEIAAFTEICTKPQRDVTALRRLIREQEAAHRAGDLDAFFTADEELHRGIFALSGYPGAWNAVQRTKLQLDRLRRLSLPEKSTVRVLINEHKQIIDAVEKADLPGGRQHISTHARRVLAHAPTLLNKHPDYFVD